MRQNRNLRCGESLGKERIYRLAVTRQVLSGRSYLRPMSANSTLGGQIGGDRGKRVMFCKSELL